MCRCPNKIAEGTKRVPADDFTIIHRFEIEAIVLFNIDIEVIVPKFDHEFVELAPTVDLPNECGLTQFIWHGYAVIIFKESIADAFKLVRIHAQRFEWLQ